jgi:putative FmdB family regulatory protein
MPRYEYECRRCFRISEVLQKLNDPPLRRCPVCRSSAIKKLISAPAILIRETAPAVPASPEVRGDAPFTVDLTLPPDFRHTRIGSLPVYRERDAASVDATAPPDGKLPARPVRENGR